MVKRIRRKVEAVNAKDGRSGRGKRLKVKQTGRGFD